MAVTASFSVSAGVTETGSPSLGTTEAKGTKSYGVSFSNGTGAGQVDREYAATRTLAASATEDLDLAGGVTNQLGAVVTFVKIKGLQITASAGNTNNVVVGGASSNAWAGLLNATGTITLRPGESFQVQCGAADAGGHTVTAGTGDLLKIANSAGTTGVTYDIIIAGTSA